VNDIFRNEWRLYRHGAQRPPMVGERPRGDAAFDAGVRPGEVRIFADASRPFVALVVEERGLAGRRIVPVSPFSVPASSREAVVGGRVFQLWNTCTASRQFTDRSWLVDTLSDDELESVLGAIAAAHPGRIAAGDGIQARYEREFLVAGGNFIPFGAPREAKSVFAGWLSGGWKVAASAAICVGAFYFILGSGRERLREWRDGAYRVFVSEDAPPIELLGEVAVEEQEPDGDFGSFPEVDGLVKVQEIPEAPVPVRVALPEERHLADIRRVGNLPIAPMKSADEGLFVDPYVMPQSVLDLGALPVLSDIIPSGGGRQVRKSAVSDSPPAVVCLAAECPWNPRSVLLNVRAAVSDGAQVEVIFDEAAVGGFRMVAGGGTRPLNAFYEVVPRASAPLSGDFCQVTVRWRATSGERRGLVPVRLADISEMEDVPERRPRARPAPPTGNGDVVVEATL